MIVGGSIAQMTIDGGEVRYVWVCAHTRGTHRVRGHWRRLSNPTRKEE